jgi:hypothetical protein
MADYVLLYGGGRMPESEEERATVMKAWDVWMHGLGSSLKDGGNPFAPGAAKTIAADGTVRDGAGSASGYSIITTNSLDDAAEKAKGCPVLEGGATIEVYEVLPVMEEQS